MSDLLLDSLLIENFRAFKRLEVKELGRVNLIVGKNNVGKTALLEALWLYAARGAQHVLAEVVRRRDEVAFLSARLRPEEPFDWTQAISSLRYGRPSPAELPDVGQNHDAYSSIDERQLFSVGSAYATSTAVHFTLEMPRVGLSIHDPAYQKEMWFGAVNPEWLAGQNERYPLAGSLAKALGARPPHSMVPHYFVPSSGLSLSKLSLAWKEVVLAGRKDVARRAIRKIDGSIKDIDFVSAADVFDRESDRDIELSLIPICQRENEVVPVPLRSMGEGMDRLLGLGLAIVVADGRNGGILLVDEIENGLHYSVQPDMWRLVFETAAKLNVQVFATTHSLDCIRAFQAVAEEHPEEGRLISLRRKQDAPDEIVAIEFDEQGMESIVRSHIEVR
ncbi:MAG: ATP-binding protein [Bacteroidota bacterium]